MARKGDREFKVEAVRLAGEPGTTDVEVERRLGIGAFAVADALQAGLAHQTLRAGYLAVWAPSRQMGAFSGRAPVVLARAPRCRLLNPSWWIVVPHWRTPLSSLRAGSISPSRC